MDWDEDQFLGMKDLIQHRLGCSEEEAVEQLDRFWARIQDRQPSPHRGQEHEGTRSPSLPSQGPRDPSPPPVDIPQPIKHGKRKIAKLNPNRTIPNKLPLMVSRYAIEKVQNMEYVLLWYFTKEGIEDAASSSSVILDNSLCLQRTESGYTLQQDKAAKASKNAVEDHKLDWIQIVTAKHNLIAAAKNWPEEYRTSLMTFFINLEEQKAAGADEDALIIYQAEARRDWHTALENEAESYDLGTFNHALFATFENRVRNKEHKELQKEVAYLRQKDSDSQGSFRGRDRRRESELGPDRRRSRRSMSPERKSYDNRFRKRSPETKPSFPACLVCLSTRSHPVMRCRETRLWDGKHPSRCSRTNEGKLIDCEGRPICVNWNKTIGCQERSSRHLHECSGCGSTAHGAQDCHLAEKASRRDSSRR